MKITTIVTATLLTSCLACFSLAEDRSGPSEKSAESHDLAVSAARKPVARDVAATGGSEVFQNVVIQAGKNVAIDSTLDYSSASTVAVTVQCTTCTSAAASLGSLGLVLQARWLVLNADSFVATESKAGTAFAYWDAGGAVFNVYGSQFRLVLQNKGSYAITLQQVTTFCHNQ
jgi:hypothetical protein